MLVQRLSRLLSESPLVRISEGIIIRHFEDVADTRRWVELINLAFKDLNPPMRRWTEADFNLRLMEQPGWSPADLFLACDQKDQLVGSVSLSFRGSGSDARPAVHLLAVRPQWRRKGVARMLVTTLESAAWARGFREIFLETHAGWHEATRFYAALGYKPAQNLTK